MRFYFPLKPQRISLDSILFKTLEEDPNFIVQVKKNGWRIQIHKERDSVILYTRHKRLLREVAPDIDHSFLTDLVLSSVKASSAIIDGEFLHRRGEKKNYLYVWDIFEKDGKPQTHSYLERKLTLQSICHSCSHLEVAQDTSTNFLQVWRSLHSSEDEGLVIKDIHEPLYINFNKTINSSRQFKVLRT